AGRVLHRPRHAEHTLRGERAGFVGVFGGGMRAHGCGAGGVLPSGTSSGFDRTDAGVAHGVESVVGAPPSAGRVKWRHEQANTFLLALRSSRAADRVAPWRVLSECNDGPRDGRCRRADGRGYAHLELLWRGRAELRLWSAWTEADGGVGRAGPHGECSGVLSRTQPAHDRRRQRLAEVGFDE